MSATTVASMSEPLSPEAPCGPDLDAQGDADYLHAMARLDGALPPSFFSFEKASIDFETDAKVLRGLIARSRDLRILVLLAKWSILYRDLNGLVDCIEAIAALLEQFWTAVHPTFADGDASYRCAILQTLDDLPTVVLPLQYATLFTARRTGPVTFRNQMVASGEVAAREGETAQDSSTIRQAMVQVDPSELAATRDVLARLKQAVSAVHDTSMERGGIEAAPDLNRLAALTERMLAFIESGLPQESKETAVSSPDAGSPDGAPSARPFAKGSINSTPAAAAALAQIAGYYERHEPSSPSLLLVRQAQQFVGRNFYEILQILFPRNADEAKFMLGGEPAIFINLDQAPRDQGSERGDDDEDAGTDDEAEPESSPAPSAESAPTDVRAVPVETRQAAQDLLGEVANFYRAGEPSNPIPILCDRARALSSLGFTALLKEVFPKQD